MALLNKDLPECSHLLFENDEVLAAVADLPPFRHSGLPRSECEYYGASSIIARALDLIDTPESEANWVHGWHWQKPTEPKLLGDYPNINATYLVADEAQEKLMRRAGYINVHPVGVPYLYSAKSTAERIPRSLLVCPGHAGNYTNQDWSGFADDYAEKITGIKDMFSTVLVCISANCVESREWIDAFESRGIPWVLGASIYDQNALIRMHQLFSKFEYVTSNIIGSHITYSAYTGCRVSIFGWQTLHSRETLCTEPFYEKNPELLDIVEKNLQEKSVQERFPHLFVESPIEAEICKDWAVRELGAPFERSPSEIADLLGWSREVLRGFNRKCFIAKRALTEIEPGSSNFVGRAIRDRARKRQYKELKHCERNKGGFVQFLGRPLRYIDAADLINTFESVFVKRALSFEHHNEKPRIVDIGGNGLSVAYFKKRFPEALIKVIEPDLDAFFVLEENLKNFEWGGVQVFNSKVGVDSKITNVIGRKFYQESDTEVSSTRIELLCKQVSFEDLFFEEGTDLLRIDARCVELRALQSAVDSFTDVNNVIIENFQIYNSPDEVLYFLENLIKAGFSVYLNSHNLKKARRLDRISNSADLQKSGSIFASNNATDRAHEKPFD